MAWMKRVNKGENINNNVDEENDHNEVEIFLNLVASTDDEEDDDFYN